MDDGMMMTDLETCGQSPSGLEVVTTYHVDADRSEYVGFAVGEQIFAFGMAKVLEIVRFPRAVAVPMTPGALVGLSNLRGRVLPVLDFRALVGMEGRAADDTTRVVVVDIGQVVGLVVDRVLRVMHVGDEAIEPAANIESLVGDDLLLGVVKGPSGALIQLMDPETVVGQTFSMEQVAQAALGGSTELGGPALAIGAPVEKDDTNRFVSVTVDGQEYGVPIEHVDEIVRVPETVGTVPNAPAHVLGIITLRDRVLPLVCLRRMFSLSPAEVGDSNRVLVVRLTEGNGRARRVGLVVDRVNEVTRVDPKVMDDVPDLLSAKGELDEITAICRLEGGRRLVSVIDVGRMFQRGEIRTVTDQAKTDPQDRENTPVDSIDTAEDRQVIVFQMIGQEFGIMVENVREILRVPEEMKRVPKTADFVVGMMNLRGGVLPVIDMRGRLGLPRAALNDRQRVVVVDLQGRRTGFVVDGVSEVLRLPASAVIDTPMLSGVQQRVLGKSVKLQGGERLILIVDPEKLLDTGELSVLDELDSAA